MFSPTHNEKRCHPSVYKVQPHMAFYPIIKASQPQTQKQGHAPIK